jgi:hypothetical protein
MNLKKIISDIFEDVSTVDGVISTEIDNFNNPLYVVKLKETMLKHGFPIEVADELIVTLVEGKYQAFSIKAKQTVDFKSKEAMIAAIKAGTHKEIKKSDGEDSEDGKEEPDERPESETEKEPEKPGKGKPKNKDLADEPHTGDVAHDLKVDADSEKKKEKQKKEKPSELSLSDKSRKNVIQKLEVNSVELIDSDVDESRKERSTDAVKLMTSFFKTTDEKKQVDIIKQLIENRYITTNTLNPDQNSRKVYFRSVNMSSEIRKLIVGASSNYMWDVAKKNGLTLEMDDSSQGRREAKYTGNVHEVGTAVEISKLTDSKNDSSETIEEANEKLDSAGGNLAIMGKINKKGAKLVVDFLKNTHGDNIKVLSTKAIGEEAAGSGLVQGDPTDLTVTFEVNGEQYQEKFSLKAYKKPGTINMKNAGIGSVGKEFFGSDVMGDKLKKLNKSKNWNFKTSKDKSEYQMAVYEILFDELSEIQDTPGGQLQLENMWKKVHGCGASVNTLIGNKTTGDVEFHKSDYYCKPPSPMKVVKKGKSITIEVGSEDGKPVLSLVTKTEKSYKSSGVLIFNHKD